jgi:hypothetical protein
MMSNRRVSLHSIMPRCSPGTARTAAVLDHAACAAAG